MSGWRLRAEEALRGWRLPVVVLAVVLVAGQLAVGMRASRTAPITGDEPFYVATAQSLVTDGDLDLADEYASGEYRAWWEADVELWRQMVPTGDGRLLSPHDPGLPLLVAPAFALGGVEGIQRLLVVLWAAAATSGAVLARRYRAGALAAAGAAVAVGAGVPGLVYASQVYPEGPAALAVGVGLLLATGRRPRPVLLALTLAALAWLGVKYVAVGGLVGLAWAWRFRGDRGAVAVAGGLAAVLGAHYVWWHLVTFGGLTPYSVNVVWAGDSDAAILADHLDAWWRSYRLYGVFLDARFGLLRWLPVAAVAVWGLRRTTRLPAATFAVGVLLATFASITIMGWWFPGRLLVAGFPALTVLVAVGAARLPRVATALGLWSLAVAAAVAWSATHGGIRLAVDPFSLGPPLPPAWLFPDFRAFGAEEVTRSLAWAAATLLPASAAAWRARRRARPAVASRAAPAPATASPPSV